MSRQEFPKMVYGKDGAQRIVGSQEEQSELGGEWRESPVDPSDEDARALADDQPTAGKAPGEVNEGTRATLDILPPDHTHRDRVEAQARSVGVKFKKSDSVEVIQRLILEHASA